MPTVADMVAERVVEGRCQHCWRALLVQGVTAIDDGRLCTGIYNQGQKCSVRRDPVMDPARPFSRRNRKRK